MERTLPDPVAQEHSSGCGIACVAFLTGNTYDMVFRNTDNPDYAWDRGYYCSELIVELRKFGYIYDWRKVSHDCRDAELPERSILFIAPNANYPIGHFIVKIANDLYMDPWTTYPSIRTVKAGFVPSYAGKISYLMFPISEKVETTG